MQPQRPITQPEHKLPAYETLPETIRRIVREELRPLHEQIEELSTKLAETNQRKGA